MTRRFKQIDVFSAHALQGNPLAVVLDGDGLDTAQMQAFARWTQLSETTFLLPPTDASADYRVRIFTQCSELLFAGHPTLGSCHAWLEAGGRPRQPGRVVQECGAGRITIRQGDGRLAFAAPPVSEREATPEELAAAAAALGLRDGQVLAARWLRNGPQWLALRLGSAEEVLALAPNHAAVAAVGEIGVIGPHPAGSDCRFEVRAFTAASGVPEDPVTGSLNAALAQWLAAEGQQPAAYQVSQGRCVGRAGRLFIERDGETVWVGGASRTCIEGSVSL